MNQRLISGTVRVVAFSAAMLLLTMLVVTRSQAAFTASTSNTGNGFTAGDLSLFDDDDDTAMFNATGMVPGSSVTECITVTYDGDVTPAPVRLYGTGTGALAPFLDLRIEVGTGGSSSSCAGFTPSGTLFDDTLDLGAHFQYVFIQDRKIGIGESRILGGARELVIPDENGLVDPVYGSNDSFDLKVGGSIINWGLTLSMRL